MGFDIIGYYNWLMKLPDDCKYNNTYWLIVERMSACRLWAPFGQRERIK